MIWSKAFGIILVLVSTSCYGFSLSRDLRKRLDELKQMKKILFLFKGEIEFSMCPVFEAALNVSRRCERPFKDMLFDFAGKEKAEKSEPLDILWKASVKKSLSLCHLCNSEKQRLLDFGNSLGMNDVETQKNNILIYMEEIENQISELEKELPAKTKLFNVLGIMFGVMISIVIM